MTTDMNTSGEQQWRQGPHAGQQMAAYQTGVPRGEAGSAGSGAPGPDRIPPGGTNVVPVLCLNTWEHVWLTDYGFGDGKTGGKVEYVQRWWRAIDWNTVANLTMPALKTGLL